MRIVITGSTGFIGKAILSLSLEKGYEVAVLVRPDSNLDKLKTFSNVQIFRYVDLSDDALAVELEIWRPDVMFHIGWKGVIGNNRNEPYQFVENINTALSSVMLASKSGCKKWIGAGSQAEYGVHHGVISEDTPCNPFNAYGKAKLATSIACLGMCELLGIQGAWGRIFSTYGPEDYPGYFIPHIISSLNNLQSPQISACAQQWDYLYVTDAAAAFISIAEHDCYGVFNIGSGKTVVLKNVVENIKSLMNSDVKVEYGKIPYSQNQVMHLEADISNLVKCTGWQPGVDITDGLKKTIQFQINKV